MKAKLVAGGIAAALAVVGIGTAVVSAAVPDQATTTQRSTVVDRGGQQFIQDDQTQGGYDCPADGTAPEASPSATTSDV